MTSQHSEPPEPPKSSENSSCEESRSEESIEMAWIKILIFFLCSFQVCFTRFDMNDFELCLEIKLQDKSINGVHLKTGLFKIEFKQFEEKVPALTTEEFYTVFKRNFGNYSELGNLQKRIIRNFIHKEMSKSLMVIMYFMSATLFSQITSKFELYMCAHRISKSVFFVTGPFK